jgi:hypothetical protein
LVEAVTDDAVSPAKPEASAVMDVAFGATVNDADTVAKYPSIFFGGT